MDELDLFRDFRTGVAAPSEDAERRASARLGRAVEGGPSRRTGALHLIARRPGYSALALVALAGATAAALFLSAPWNDSPGFLERAQAALTPGEDTILHMKWEVTSTSTDPACTVQRGPNEIWIDQTPPHTYRALLSDIPPLPSTWESPPPACSPGEPFEIGGTLGGTFDEQDRFRFVPPITLEYEPLRFLVRADDPFAIPTGGALPAALWAPAMLREAIGAGTAHDEGETQLEGRTVRRIRVEPSAACPPPLCPPEPSYVYVDPKTYFPVQVEGPRAFIPLLPDRVVPLHVVDRYLTFEYLPRTEANLALTDIRAQHPNAKVE
jgi:hypothetical protein